MGRETRLLDVPYRTRRGLRFCRARYGPYPVTFALDSAVILWSAIGLVTGSTIDLRLGRSQPLRSLRPRHRTRM